MDQHAPPVDDNLGPTTLAICTPIFALALLLYVIRVFPRMTPTIKLGYADYIVSLAVLCELITYSFFVAMIVYGFGRQTYYLSVEELKKITRYAFPVAVVGQMASALARMSIPALLIRFGTSRTWKISLVSVIVIQAVILLGSEILLLCSCRPIRALWEIMPDAQCIPSRVLWTTGYIYTGVNLLADLVCATAPLFVVIKLSRSKVERTILCFSMALGIVATVATAARIKHLRGYQISSSRTFRDQFPLHLLTRIEELVLLVAASAPFLKPIIERILRRWNLPTFQNQALDLNPHHTTSESDCNSAMELGSTEALNYNTKETGRSNIPYDYQRPK